VGAGTNGAAGKGGSSGTAGTGVAGTNGAAGKGGSAGTGVAGTNGAAGKGGNGGSTGAAGTGAAGTTGTGGASCTTPPAASPLMGWASVSGMGVTTTTGGGSATPQTVTSESALASAVGGTGAAVIYVKGVLGSGKIKVGSNKTIVGLCGAEIHGNLTLGGSSNVIIRNVKIVGYGVGNCALDPDYDSSVGCSSGNDAVTVNAASHHIWFDHCDISDGTDGNLDITNGSDFVSVSWTKFHYTTRTDNNGNDSTGAEGHRFSNLIGADDGLAVDVGHLNVTWHHDWWADNVVERMPRSRAGKIHLFNNLFTSTGDSYCTNAGDGTHLLVESNVYNGVKAPLQPDSDGDMLAKNNIFTNTSGTTAANGTGFSPTYAYTADAASGVMSEVESGAGPK
jgi:pectate lyase